MPGPTTIQFDWTITVGSLLTGFSIVAAIVTAIAKYANQLRARIDEIDRKTDQMHRENRITIAVIEARVTDMWEAFKERL